MKIHTIPLNIGDLMADTAHMNAAEFGAYMRLIMHHYRMGVDGIPADEQKLIRMSGCSRQQWYSVRDIVLECFEEKDGKLYNNSVGLMLLSFQKKAKLNKANYLKRKQSGQNSDPIQPTNTIYNIQDTNNNKGKSPDPGSYAFDGEVIKLREKDFQAWMQSADIDEDQMYEWLANRDMYLETLDAKTRKKWFYTTSIQLRKEFRGG
jgi:uncharacterized protein YdaU (DUF1376 family)